MEAVVSSREIISDHLNIQVGVICVTWGGGKVNKKKRIVHMEGGTTLFFKKEP